MARKNRLVEERMMREYIAEELPGRTVSVHLRVGAPPGMDPSAPGYEQERRFFLPALPEADVVYRDGDDVWILEFGIWRPLIKLGQLQVYGELLPETPGFLDVKPEQIKLKIVTGRHEFMADRLAQMKDIDVEIWTKPWLTAILAGKTGTQS